MVFAGLVGVCDKTEGEHKVAQSLQVMYVRSKRRESISNQANSLSPVSGVA